MWISTSDAVEFPRLETDDIHVDVAIVGAGITGITAGILLKQAGKRVAVLDAQRVGAGVTGCTTAHITEIIDTRF